MSATGINIGDAVLTFLGDTSQLDQTVARLGIELPSKLRSSNDVVDALGKNFTTAGTAASAAADRITSKMAPATASVGNLGKELSSTSTSAIEAGAGIAKMGDGSLQAAGDVEQLSVEMAVATSGAKELGDVMTLSGEKARFSMYEARGEAQLLGEAIGVQLPRHVNSFLAELPGVGKALSAAFEATAVFFLIEALIEGSKKLSEFIADTFIFTEAMKKSDEITKEMDVELQKHSETIKKLKDDYLLLGLTGVAKTSEQMKLLNEQIKQNAAGFDELQAKALAGDPEAQKDAAIRVATAKDLQQQLTNLSKQGAIERQEVAHKAALAEVEIDKERADSIALLKANENKQLAADAGNSAAVLTQIDARYQLDIYNNQLAALQRKLALDKTDRTKDPGLISQDLEKIEALQRDHASALIKIYADTVAGINALSLGESGNRTGIADAILGTDFQDKFGLAEEAAKSLGIELSGSLAENVDVAAKAYEDLKATGVASLTDLYSAELAVLRLQRQFATGDEVGPILNRIDAVTEAYNKLHGIIGRTARQSHDYWQTFQLDLQKGVPPLKSLTSTFGEAFNQLAQGIQGAVAAAILGQESLGTALRKAVSQALAAYAAQEAIMAIIYTAEGFAALAGFAEDSAANYFTAAAFAGAAAGAAGTAAHFLAPSQSSSGSSSASGANSTGGQVSPTQTEQAPIQTVNTQRLGSGGLITQRTLAVIGDAATGSGSQREAVIPVDDSRFMDAVAGGLAQRLGPAGNVTHVTFHVEGLVSADHLHKFVKKVSQSINKGSVRLNASNSLRVTRRS